MTTTKPQVKIVNCETGEEITRDASNSEIAQMAKDKADYVAKQVEAEAKATARAALLDKLGITADEAKLLLG
jgi:hypothetical protein